MVQDHVQPRDYLRPSDRVRAREVMQFKWILRDVEEVRLLATPQLPPASLHGDVAQQSVPIQVGMEGGGR